MSAISIITRLKCWAKKLKSNIALLYVVYKHKLTPWYAKAVAAFTVGYALSPIDLIPDFIPVLGFLDDVILLPALIWISFRLIPRQVIESCREEAKEVFAKGRPKNYRAGTVIIAIWLILITMIIWRLVR